MKKSKFISKYWDNIYIQRFKEYNNSLSKDQCKASSLPVKDLFFKITELVKKLNIKNSKILDVGGGDGRNLEYFFDKSNEKSLVDISNIAIESAIKRRIKAYKVNLEEESLPFKDESFDFVLLIEVIEHIYNYEFLMAELYRVSKKDAYLLITTPNLVSLSGRIKMLFGFSPTALSWDPSHIRFFTLKKIKQLLKKYKFEIIKVDTTGVYLQSPFLNFIKIPFLEKISKSLGEHIIILASKK